MPEWKLPPVLNMTRLNTTLLNTTLAMALEKAIKQTLRHDPGTRARLAQLSGRRIAIDIQRPALCLTVLLHDSDVSVHASPYEDEGERTTEHEISDGPLPDCRIRGDLSALLTLACTKQHSLANSDIDIIGDTVLLARLTNIVRDLDIDWQEILSDHLGDIFGVQLSEGVHTSLAWINDKAQKAPRYIGELLSEELRYVPTTTELETFTQNVNTLRSDVERLNAKMERHLKSIQT